jgi:hypothetical protein
MSLYHRSDTAYVELLTDYAMTQFQEENRTSDRQVIHREIYLKLSTDESLVSSVNMSVTARSPLAKN